MRKAILVVALVAAAGVGVFIFFSKYLAETEIKSRIKDLFRQAGMVRKPYSAREYNIQAEFFDDVNYDQNARHPVYWLEIWKADNELHEFGRQFDSMKIVNATKTDAEIEFTMLEGFKGSGEVPPAMKPVAYKAKLFYREDKQTWYFRSLKYAADP